MKRLLLLTLLSGVWISQRAIAADTGGLTPAQMDFFENKVRPILVDNCYQCHSTSAEKIKAGLLLDTKAGMLKGGDTGPAIVPGDPDHSLLIKAVSYTDSDLQMPKKGKLSDEQITDLTTWVKMGAPDPRVSTAQYQYEAGDTKAKHWAWQPLKPVALPSVSDTNWCQTPVDYFILSKLDAAGLKPSPAADKRTLIRRATFDLTGLPPTPEEVQNFVDDDSPDAFAKVVDRLLGSPHYGECWGRHWLDVARYSDTKGQPKRNVEDNLNPFAWTYRDYVIHSFNEDKPYNRFILEQIAADRLGSTASDPTNLAALGFLTVGDHFMGMQNDILNDRIDVVTKGFQALTVTCARCHDHKFDPIPQQDYYSLRGIFDSCVEPKAEPVISKISYTPAYEAYYNQRQKLIAQQAALEQSLPQIRRSGDRDKVKETQRYIEKAAHEINDLDFTNPAAPERAMVLLDLMQGHDSPLFIRGDPGNKGPLVPRRFLQVLSPPYRQVYEAGSGRLQLAQAIANKSNPMTARVMINRMWQYHFGQGFVPTPDDFGMMSEPPSDQPLLDYLAESFMTNGWSIKKIQRLIMLSAVYQESSDNNPRYALIDPGNRLLWRANIRRLEFEQLRDSLLAIGGMLDTTMYGRPVDLRQHPDSTRRTIYDFVDRANIPDVWVNFDFATPDMETGIRHVTTVPQQALFLMNSPLVIELARRLVAMPEFVDNADDQDRLKFLYERIYQRPPTSEETELGLEFVNQTPMRDDTAATLVNNDVGAGQGQKQGLKQGKKNKKNNRFGDYASGPNLRRRAPLTSWEEYAQALLQANETSFVN